MTFCILGNDDRQLHLTKLLIEKNIKVLPHDMAKLADILIFPTPLRKEDELFRSVVKQGYPGIVFAGAISAEQRAIGKDLRLYDYAADEVFALQNALPSAEGALYCIMKRQKKVLQGSNIAILGYGRIAKLLSQMLKSLNCNVDIFSRKASSQAEAASNGYISLPLCELKHNVSDVDILVNTIPAPIVDKDILSGANPDIYLLDLASAPGGIKKNDAELCKLSVDWVPGLPAIYSPHTAAEYVINSIEKILGGNICTTKK